MNLMIVIYYVLIKIQMYLFIHIQSINITKNNLINYSNRVKYYQGSYKDIDKALNINYINKKINGIILDLGFGSHQISNIDKGMDFMNNKTLDMRYNPVLKLYIIE